mmetsp:Transcript_6635/g.7093  ORF Transcript_6635/g.7093 Transcript_6635/m.7093 type:complete len:1060 (-) Transcript_6635:521-3700(-)
MSGINSFIPLIPEDVKSARIGSGFDTVTGKLKSRAEVFHLGKLNRADLLEQIDGSLTTKYHVDQSSSDIQSNSFFGSDTEAKTSFWCVSASVGASMDKEKAQANSSFSENLVLQSLNTGGYMLVRGVTSLSDDVYNCTFDAFKDHYDPIMKATTTLEYFAAYENFSKIYGDSCVTKVHLIAGSALQITLRKEGSSQSSNAKYGASASVSTPLGGVSAASEWGSGMSAKHSGGTMTCKEIHYPSDTPTYKLIHAEFQKRNNAGLATLTADALKNSIPKNNEIIPVTAPAIIPYEGDPETMEPPEKAVSDNEIKKEDDKKDEALARKDGHKGTLEEYRKDKRKEIKDLKNNTTKTNGGSNVAKEASDVLKDRANAKSNGGSYYDILGVTKAATRSEINNAYTQEARLVHPDTNKDDPDAHEKFIELKRIHDTLRDPVKRKLYDEGYNNKNRISTPAVADNKMSLQQLGEVDENTNTWSLGGYCVNAYETTKWTELFPELSRNFLEDDGLIYVIRLWLYLLTRLEFLQYLRFQIDVGRLGCEPLSTLAQNNFNDKGDTSLRRNNFYSYALANGYPVQLTGWSQTRNYAYGYLRTIGNTWPNLPMAVVSGLVPGGIYAFKVYQYASLHAGTNLLSVNGISLGSTTSSKSMEATAEGEATADGQGRITFTFTAQSDHVQLSGLAIGRCQTSKMNLINLKNDANLFSILCDGLQQVIEAALNKPDFSQVDYLIQILAFDDKLRIDNLRRFASMKVYDIFFEHYDVFHNNPLGFVQISHTVDGDEYTAYTEVGNPTIKQSVGKASLPTLLTDARRCYPVINVDGNTVMVAYHRARIGPGQFVVVSPSSAWDKGDIVAIRSSYTVTENRPAFLDSEKDSGHAFLHFASNQNKDTRQWKFEKIGDNYAIKNIGTGKYLEARPSNQTRDVLVTDRTPTSTDTSLLWHVDTSEYDSHYFSQIPPMLKNISSQCWLSWVDKNDIPPWMSSNVDGPTHWYLDSDPGNFFQDFHKDPNDKLGLEAYISSDQRTTFVGLNYEHRHLNDHIMVGVPFLSRLPFDEIVSPLHPEDA